MSFIGGYAADENMPSKWPINEILELTDSFNGYYMLLNYLPGFEKIHCQVFEGHVSLPPHILPFYLHLLVQMEAVLHSVHPPAAHSSRI